MVRILRKMVREVAMLPLPVKFFVGLMLAVNFVVITQWERLTLKQPAVHDTPKVSISPQKPEQRSFNFPEASDPDKARAAAAEAALAKRMARLIIKDPVAQANGSIIGNGQTVHLYGIKQFDSKTVCTRPSGERWACGLQAYATLRNTTVKKTIICDPKKILSNGVSAVCRIGSIDVALMLVRDGLAELDGNIDDAEMKKAQVSAKSQKLGIWDR